MHVVKRYQKKSRKDKEGRKVTQDGNIRVKQPGGSTICSRGHGDLDLAAVHTSDTFMSDSWLSSRTPGSLPSAHSPATGWQPSNPSPAHRESLPGWGRVRSANVPPWGVHTEQWSLPSSAVGPCAQQAPLQSPSCTQHTNVFMHCMCPFAWGPPCVFLCTQHSCPDYMMHHLKIAKLVQAASSCNTSSS